MKGVVLAGDASGVGKTVATLATIRAFERAGVSVQPAKAGPDFIDPSHHARVAGRPSRTLDPWLQGAEGIRRNYYRGDGAVCVVEGVMGLYDGDRASTAAVAETLGLPVVLILDGSGGMESLAATAVGFQHYARHAGRDIDVVGIIAQRTHEGRHAAGIREALPSDLRYFGRIPPRDGLEIPERHLGLEMGDEAPIEGETLDDVSDHLDVAALLDVAQAPPRPSSTERRATTDARVAIAHDQAFRFIYPAVIDRFEERAEVVRFRPTEGDECPDCDGVYLPGGYPELHADRLATSPALATLSDRASEGLPVLAECGGLMALAESLTTTAGDTYEMAGVLPAEIQMCDRLQALDHVELRATRDHLTARRGESRHGHEFHYSRATVGTDARFAFETVRGTGIDGTHDGLTEHRTLGTYSHLHTDSGAFDAFIDTLES